MTQTVWITGGSRGIGAETVALFARRGWQVAFTYRASRDRAQALVDRLTGAGCTVQAFPGDMTDREAVRRCAGEIEAAFGAVDALVCNAAIAQQKMFCDITDADWEQVFLGNVRAVYYPIGAVLDGMVRRKAGSIVTLSSVWGVTGASCESHYAASKAAIIGLSKSLAQELGLSNIRVNCVAPGVIATDMNKMHDADTMAALAEETALGRIGQPDEVARAIYYLCSEEASFVTGQVLGVTGGFMI